MEYKGFTLDRFQEDSIRAVDNDNSVVVSAPTGSGKTLIADYIINKYLKKGIKVIYTAPIKALSNQKYKEFSGDYGKDSVGLLTGDIVINPGAQVLIMTTEIYRNMALISDPMLDSVKYVVFDEIHYINDIERGYVWEESIIFSKEHVRFLCLSATIPNAEEFAKWIRKTKKHPVDVVRYDKRHVPLFRYFYDTELGICSLDDIKEVNDIPEYHRGKTRRQRVKPPDHVELVREIMGKLPCFFFYFSRMGCQDSAVELAKARLFKINPEIGGIVRKKLDNAAPEIKNLKSTRLLRETLPYGIAFHHAGLIPLIKELVEELFSQGLIKVLYTTETFAVGINMPAKTVAFRSLRKFDGANFRFLNSKEYFQIAGRAGRRGIDKEGYVYAMIDRRDFDYQKLRKMTDKDIEPIRSQFRLSVNTVLNIIRQHSPAEIDRILRMNFFTFQKGSYSAVKRSFESSKRKLQKLDYIRDGRLTEKGEFSSRIYADEILIGEIFGTDFYQDLSEYQILLIIACLAYEPREKTRFYSRYPTEFLSSLKKKIHRSPSIAREKRFRSLNKITALVDPAYHGKDIFELMKNTNLVEGDIIRLFRQILDRLAQIRHATGDERLKQMAASCQDVIIASLADVDTI